MSAEARDSREQPRARAGVRKVTASRKDGRGYVTHLGNENESWSPRSTWDVIVDIEIGACSYQVVWPEKNTLVYTADDAGGRYLRTDRNTRPHNDLLDLPDC